MNTELYWDRRAKLLCSGDPARLSPQQRANWTLLRALMEAEYRRGFEKGREEAQIIVDTGEKMV